MQIGHTQAPAALRAKRATGCGWGRRREKCAYTMRDTFAALCRPAGRGVGRWAENNIYAKFRAGRSHRNCRPYSRRVRAVRLISRTLRNPFLAQPTNKHTSTHAPELCRFSHLLRNNTEAHAQTHSPACWLQRPARARRGRAPAFSRILAAHMAICASERARFVCVRMHAILCTAVFSARTPRRA